MTLWHTKQGISNCHPELHGKTEPTPAVCQTIQRPLLLLLLIVVVVGDDFVGCMLLLLLLVLLVDGCYCYFVDDFLGCCFVG